MMMFSVKFLFGVSLFCFLIYVCYISLFKKERVPLFVEGFFISVLLGLFIALIFPRFLRLLSNFLNVRDIFSVIVYLSVFFLYVLVYFLYIIYGKFFADVGKLESEVAILDFELDELRKRIVCLERDNGSSSWGSVIKGSKKGKKNGS